MADSQPVLMDDQRVIGDCNPAPCSIMKWYWRKEN